MVRSEVVTTRKGSSRARAYAPIGEVGWVAVEVDLGAGADADLVVAVVALVESIVEDLRASLEETKENASLFGSID